MHAWNKTNQTIPQNDTTINEKSGVCRLSFNIKCCCCCSLAMLCLLGCLLLVIFVCENNVFMTGHGNNTAATSRAHKEQTVRERERKRHAAPAHGESAWYECNAACRMSAKAVNVNNILSPVTSTGMIDAFWIMFHFTQTHTETHEWERTKNTPFNSEAKATRLTRTHFPKDRMNNEIIIKKKKTKNKPDQKPFFLFGHIKWLMLWGEEEITWSVDGTRFDGCIS